MKNKIKYMISAVSVAVLTAPALALAQFAPPVGTGLSETPITVIVTNFMKWILMLVGILGVIGFAIAGILYLTAAGDEDRISSAKKAMVYSIIGVVVALLGLVIITAVSNALGGSSTTY